MSQSIRDFEKSFTSTADLSAEPYVVVAVDLSNDNSVVLATADTDPIVGVLQNEPKAGEAALIRFIGTTKVVLGGVVARGDAVTTNATGEGVTTAVAGTAVIGKALDSGVAGDIIEVLLTISTI